MGHESPLLERLRAAGHPRETRGWQDGPDYFVAATRVSADDIPALIDILRYWIDPKWHNNLDASETDRDTKERRAMLPVSAWRTLAELRASAAVGPLIEVVRELGDEIDDWTLGEAPVVFGKIGESAVAPLFEVAANTKVNVWTRTVAARGLRWVAEFHASARDRVVALLTELIENCAENSIQFNSTLVDELVELRAVGAADAIERAYAANQVDHFLDNDWEQVRKKLGVEGQGLKMPKNPHCTLGFLRHRMGIGVFSDRSVFLEQGDEGDKVFEEAHEATKEAYFRKATDAFRGSPEGEQA